MSTPFVPKSPYVLQNLHNINFHTINFYTYGLSRGICEFQNLTTRTIPFMHSGSYMTLENKVGNGC